MGTNYYCRHIPTEEEYEKMQESLNNRDYEKLETYLKEFRATYHIGKDSYGWQFIFCPHISESGDVVSPWENTFESIKEYLSRDDVEIFDEYQRSYTCDQFFEKIADSLYKGLDLETYWNIHPEECSYLGDYSMHEFKNDGLNFSKTHDFI